MAAGLESTLRLRSTTQLRRGDSVAQGKSKHVGENIQGVCRQSAKAKLKNRHFTGGYRGSRPFFLTVQTGSKFPVDKRNIKDVYFFQFQQQEKSAILQILHF